ncbi:MAG: bi-domain-containing oxidoreductase, partial [Candidatus Omnitrophica bacterium]|nr:bi-domain-containing oxidoreductase [Candidatus Omnitrophota bacterium]
MKQILQSLTGGQIFVGEVPAPTVESGTLLVRARCSAISVGTERATIQRVQRGVVGNAFAQPELVQALFRQLVREGLGPTLEKVRSRLEQPIPLGYSCAGVVQEVGEAVEGFQTGTPVACAGYGYASHAEWVLVPKNLCAKIPEGVSWEEAAFTTLGAIALQGIRVADLEIGETVLVIGLGIVGQLIAQAAQAAGCRVFGVDPRPERVAMAKEVGMEEGSSSIEPEELLQGMQPFTAGHGFDAVIIAAATEDPQPLLLAGELARERGYVVVVGDVPLEVPRQRFYEKELQLRLARSYGPGRYDPTYERHGLDYPFSFVRWTAQRNMKAFLQLAASGRVRVSPLITHRFPIHQAPDAYELITAPARIPSLGIVLQYETTAAAAPGVSPTAEASQTPRSAPGMVGIGVVGAGRFGGGVLLPILRKMRGVQLRGLAAAHGSAAQAVARRFRIPSSTTDYRLIVKDPSIQALIIATPHHLHAQMILEGLRCGRHLFVEKP